MSPTADVIDIRAPRAQRVLMLSWEYPPVVVGGLGRHVHALSVALANAGHEVTVVTRHAPGAPLEEYADGVRIIRAAEDPPLFPLATPSLLAWTMAFNHTLTRAALRATQSAEYDVIHAHDWLVTHTAITLKEHLDIPLVATIHATEAGRHQGWLPNEMNKSIHSIEHWLGHESCRVITCSEYMRWEVSQLLELPAARVDVIANGVNDRVWRSSARAVAAAREKYAADGPLIGFAGRLVYEKGVQHLIAALPWLRQRHAGLRVIIAGDGPYRGELQAQAERLGVADLINFAGFMTEAQLPAVLGATDATVVPSLYEPFGMVALEAAAAGAPLAVSATGGLAEIVEPGVTGMRFQPQDSHGLAEAVHALLVDEVFARRVARAARQQVIRRYGWSTIAAQTAAAYATAVREAPSFNTRRAAAQLAGGAHKIVVPDGNLLAVGSAS
ncbi:glycosyltransferase family 4 protein [Solwaraspora sp. WMMD406]|uniref:glycosyltransferase family 4 protein n=1 Tax=Solwaraspora sp. WMMD406 TaxID=3016095 RepID=UPI00241666C5|nr:glycosyltransferase family 4 protein [Solwaraspora sp. WMMD406]MDG4765664.1 glycosyltransferase family 4 protein [Solwaraspora sp. WMMD406]